MKRYDVVIVGTGPAGLAAAMNLKIRKKEFLLLGSKGLSEQVQLSQYIDNVLGLPHITGPELNKTWGHHIAEMGIQITEDRVNQVYAMGDYYAVSGKNEQYEATCVIMAAGLIRNRGLEGEDTFLGRGVSYCATCDGALFQDKHVAVLAGNEEALHEARYLASIAAKVTLVPLLKRYAHPSEGNIELVNKLASGISGENKALKLHFKDGSELPIDGIFIIKNGVGPQYLVPGITATDESINVNELMETNLPGLYAAGDCAGRPWQLMKAMGQGQTAALSAVSYLDSLEK